MKNKKISIKIIIIILLIVIIIIGFLSLNNKNSNISKFKTSKEQLTETTNNNTYVGMATHLSEIENQEEKLLAFKSAIANAITEMGVETSKEDSSDTMANNIKSITTVSAIRIKSLIVTAKWSTEGANSSNYAYAYGDVNIYTDGRKTVTIGSVSLSSGQATMYEYDSSDTSLGTTKLTGNTTITLNDNTSYIRFYYNPTYAYSSKKSRSATLSDIVIQ